MFPPFSHCRVCPVSHFFSFCLQSVYTPLLFLIQSDRWRLLRSRSGIVVLWKLFWLIEDLDVTVVLRDDSRFTP
jgi:hypothetical protein